MPNPKSRAWTFTLNNYVDADLARLADSDAYRYCLYGKEVGESGTPHLQGYLYFPGPVRMQSVKKVAGDRAHVEIARGSVKHNFDYCTKDGDAVEHGDRPDFQEEKGKKEKARYKRAWDLAKCGDVERIAEESPDIALRFYSTIKRIKQDALTERKLTDTPEIMQWYYGPSGTGKSRKAREENPDAYLKNCNKWWDGYVDQDVVLVEDFDRKHDVLVHHLKLWADRYPFLAEVKNGSMTIRPRRIIVTSNYHPKDIWTEEKDFGPILRRFHVTHFHSLGSIPIIAPPQLEEDSDFEDTQIVDLTE